MKPHSIASLSILLALGTAPATADIASNKYQCEQIPERLRAECLQTVGNGREYTWYNPTPKSSPSKDKEAAAPKESDVTLSVRMQRVSKLELTDILVSRMERSGWVLESLSDYQIDFVRPVGSTIGGMILGDFISGLIGGRSVAQMQGPYCRRMKFSIVSGKDGTEVFPHVFFVGNYGSEKEIAIPENDPTKQASYMEYLFSSIKDREMVFLRFDEKSNNVRTSNTLSDLM